MIRAEYDRFLQTINSPFLPEPVRKIANLVATHLDNLIPLTTHQGQRIRSIVDLAQAHWDWISPEIGQTTETNEQDTIAISKITSMEVGPFRGFAVPENFDLSSNIVLIYGPNGTGKTSFCEALEYGLLGNVLEADSSRFRSQEEYLKNAYTNQFAPPRILARDLSDNEFVITPNELNFRFCFIEKNRIDNFSRIAAQLPSRQTALISTLFGLDTFSEFVRNFTAEIDARYIDLSGIKNMLLIQKQQALASAQQQVRNATAELESIASEEAGLANQYRSGYNYNQMLNEIQGGTNATGRIKTLENELIKPTPTKSNISFTGVLKLGENIGEITQELFGLQQFLASAGQKVSFQKLYKAVSQLQTVSPNNCPACKTPLLHTLENPYTNAEKELTHLKDLSDAQKNIQLLEQSLHLNLLSLAQIVNNCLSIIPTNNPLAHLGIPNNVHPNLNWWKSIHHTSANGQPYWNQLLEQARNLEERDKAISEAEKNRAEQAKELDTLRWYLQQATIFNTRRQTATQSLASANQTIYRFNEENAALIEEANSEKLLVSRNREISDGYAAFVRMLNNYNRNLPINLVKDLGEQVTNLYNSFNRNDPPADLLENVILPLSQNDRLQVAFAGDTRTYDALQVLSEGHIRCLGLAILLAKNLKEGAPVLIFDDPVNAIDDDHRDSIRRTLFEDGIFSNKQIILTCHGEEFFKDIQNLLPVTTVRESKLISFLPRLEDKGIRIDFNCSPRNYIISARQHLDRNEIRDSLSKSRQALETLTKGKIWTYVHRYGDGNLSLKLRSSKAPLELRNLTEQLKSKIGKNEFSDPQKGTILQALDHLLGHNGDSREWRYLNKGTHEENDRAEFDRNAVREIVENLENIETFFSLRSQLVKY